MSPNERSLSLCTICGASTAAGASAGSLKPGLRRLVTEQCGRPLQASDHVCTRCLRSSRISYLESRLVVERGHLTELESEVARRAAEHLVIASDTNREVERSMTLGQRTADRVARVGGSWPFVISFGVFIVIWTLVNSVILSQRAFDPYPYILLNLVLSCLAAIQAPVIMMSQNRSNAHDRARAEEDYGVNLKAELEIGGLHEKIDHLLHERWESIIEMQHAQLELLRELLERRSSVPAMAGQSET